MFLNSSIIREIKETPLMCHCASVIENAEGKLICVWYEGAYETSSDTTIKISYRNSETCEWEKPETLFGFQDVPLGNPVLFSFDKKKLFLMFSFLLGESWKESILCIARSDDEGETWSNPSILSPREGFMAKTRPIRLTSGRIIMPIYHETEICPYIMILNDMASFLDHHLVAETMARGKALQPVVVELEPDKLLMFCRTNKGTIWKSLSYNGGLSWSIFTPTLLPNPNSAIDLLQTTTGELILAFNNSSHNRHSLSIALSNDKGKSWSFMRTIEQGEGEYSYPCLHQDKNGSIHLVYTENRYQIKHIHFDVEWLQQEALSTPIFTDEVPSD